MKTSISHTYFYLYLKLLVQKKYWGTFYLVKDYQTQNQISGLNQSIQLKNLFIKSTVSGLMMVIIL